MKYKCSHFISQCSITQHYYGTVVLNMQEVSKTEVPGFEYQHVQNNFGSVLYHFKGFYKPYHFQL